MMSITSRREVLAVVTPRYRAARGEERTRILEEFIACTGYHRKYAAPLAQSSDHQGDGPQAASSPAAVCLWCATGAGDVLAGGQWHMQQAVGALLPELGRVLEQHGELHLEAQTKERLLALSPATADRLWHAERARAKPHGVGTTKPGTLLKSAIPIRTFAEWDEAQPGFTEIERARALWHDHTWGVFAEPDRHRCRHGLDPVCGVTQSWPTGRLCRPGAGAGAPAVSFTRHRFAEWQRVHQRPRGSRSCQQEQLTLTRSRPDRKNDQAYVEQKNWSVVRQLVGYERYESQAAYEVLGALYEVIRLYVNFFQPSVKLLSKARVGGKVKKTYDQAKTPYQRVLDSEQVSEEVKERLPQQYAPLNPMALLRQMQRLQALL